MARSTAMTTQTEIDQTTVTVEIHHADFGADATADVRCFGLDELTQDVFDEHYESLGEPVEIDSGVLDAGEPVLAIEILEDVWRRTQGGRTDDELPYDGSQVRSSCVGDVVVLDGVPFAVADVGFERVELDVDQDDDQIGLGDRFPRDDVSFEEGARVWIEIPHWLDVIGQSSSMGRGGRKGVEVIEDRPDDGELVVEGYQRGEDVVATVDRRSAVATDLIEGEQVAIEYESVYSDSRVEKTGTISNILRSRGKLGGSFDGLYVEIDDERTYYVGNSGVVKTKDPRRTIGRDAVVERVEDEQDDDLPERPAGCRPDGEGVEDPHAHQKARLEDAEEDIARAEIQAEAEQQARYERHVDRHGWH